MVLQWSQQTVVGPHRIAIYKSVKKHSATEQMSQTQAQLVKGLSNTSASADVITVDSSGNVGINKTSPVKDLDVTGEIRASTGILFGTDTAAANTLDDYEEGTWTPSFVNGTFTYNVQSGQFTKIGNVITIHAQLSWTAKSGTGILRTTLPATGAGTRFSGSLGYVAGVDISADYRQLVLASSAGENFTTWFILADNTSPSNATVQNLSATGEVQYTMTYTVQ